MIRATKKAFTYLPGNAVFALIKLPVHRNSRHRRRQIRPMYSYDNFIFGKLTKQTAATNGGRIYFAGKLHRPRCLGRKIAFQRHIVKFRQVLKFYAVFGGQTYGNHGNLRVFFQKRAKVFDKQRWRYSVSQNLFLVLSFAENIIHGNDKFVFSTFCVVCHGKSRQSQSTIKAITVHYRRPAAG